MKPQDHPGLDGPLCNRPLPHDVKRAIVHMHKTIGQKMTMAELSTVTGAAERTLRKNFARFIGVPPLAYWRKLRLTVARDRLLVPSADRTVTKTATFVGYSHLGRFASDYRRCFGELPSTTQHRHRATPSSQPNANCSEQERLAVGFTLSAVLHPFVPTMLRTFRRMLPDVRMELDEAGMAELVEALLHGRLDAAFVRSSVDSVPGLMFDAVLNEPMMAALPTEHRLAIRHRQPLPLADFATEAFILFSRRAAPGPYDAILAACREAGFAPVVAQEVSRLSATLGPVAAGLGISIVPASMKRMVMAGVTYRRLEIRPGLLAPLHLALRRTSLSGIVARFRAEVHRLAGPCCIQSAWGADDR